MKQSLIGIDIIEIDRIRHAIDRWGERFLHRIYTEAELALCRGRPESLAARFSGKEAVFKALAPPAFAGDWKDIEILAEPNGKPQLILHGRLAELARERQVVEIEISLSHSRQNAVAMVIGLRKGRMSPPATYLIS